MFPGDKAGKLLKFALNALLLEVAAGVFLFLGFNSHGQQLEVIDVIAGALGAGGDQPASWY